MSNSVANLTGDALITMAGSQGVANLTADAVIRAPSTINVLIANITCDVIVRSPAITITDKYRPSFVGT